MPKNKPISSVKVNELFASFSLDYGYDPSDYTHELATLISLWEEQGYIEIYQTVQDRDYGKIKSSEEDGKGSFIYQYCDLYHARVTTNGHDPLVVVKFHSCDDNPEVDYVSLRFLSNHEQLFGTTRQKYNKAELKVLRDQADKKIQDGNDTEG